MTPGRLLGLRQVAMSAKAASIQGLTQSHNDARGAERYGSNVGEHMDAVRHSPACIRARPTDAALAAYV